MKKIFKMKANHLLKFNNIKFYSIERNISKEATIISEGLKRIYNTKIKHFEEISQFDKIYPYSSSFSFDSKPKILLLGNYSSGK